jgi:hypothetical protein
MAAIETPSRPPSELWRPLAAFFINELSRFEKLPENFGPPTSTPIFIKMQFKMAALLRSKVFHLTGNRKKSARFIS